MWNLAALITQIKYSSFVKLKTKQDVCDKFGVCVLNIRTVYEK